MLTRVTHHCCRQYRATWYAFGCGTMVRILIWKSWVRVEWNWRLVMERITLQRRANKAHFTSYTSSSISHGDNMDQSSYTFTVWSNTFIRRIRIYKNRLRLATPTQQVHFICWQWLWDTVGKIDEADPTKGNADENLGLKKGASFTGESKVVDMIGRLHVDIFNQKNTCWIWWKRV